MNHSQAISDQQMEYQPADEPAAWTLNILVVDDDPVDLDICARYLTMCGAFNSNVVRAGNGDEALTMAADSKLDCVLLDQILPDSSGTELIDALKTRTGDPSLPIIMLTGHGDEAVVVEAMHHGAADYLSKKEFAPASLQRSIKNAVEKSRLSRLLAREREVLVEMNHELLSKTREIETFYQIVSHELKTPLTAMREYNSLMLDGVGGTVTEDQAEFLGIAIECCDRLTGMVNDLFDTARVAADKMSITAAETRLDDLIERRVNELRGTARNAGLTIDLEMNVARREFFLDATRIGQVITNLLTNAIKFTDPGGFICVVLDATEDQFSITVTDTGRGIAVQDQQRIFERYYQAEDGVDRKSGMGIGLYLCASIAKLHGGTIEVESAPGQGSSFVLRVPAVAGEGAETVA